MNDTDRAVRVRRVYTFVWANLLRLEHRWNEKKKVFVIKSTHTSDDWYFGRFLFIGRIKFENEIDTKKRKSDVYKNGMQRLKSVIVAAAFELYSHFGDNRMVNLLKRILRIKHVKSFQNFDNRWASNFDTIQTIFWWRIMGTSGNGVENVESSSNAYQMRLITMEDIN